MIVAITRPSTATGTGAGLLSALALVLTLTLASLPLMAQDVYKCRARDGAISYQDRACAADAVSLDAPSLPKTYAPPPPPGDQEQASAADPSGIAPPQVARIRVEDPLPQMYRCVSPDGSSYVSSDPAPRGRYVPLWTLGYGSYGTGLTQGRGDPRLGAAYTYVEDRCRSMPRGELCGYWKQRADETRSERRHAFKDRRALLDQEYAGTRDALARFCR